jgi:hypothetical protein
MGGSPYCIVIASSTTKMEPTFASENRINFIEVYTDPEARVRFPALPEQKTVGLERGPLSFVSTTEELLHRKIATPV